MSMLMRKMLGFYMDVAEDGDTGGAGGGTATDDQNKDDGTPGGEGGAAAQTGAEQPKTGAEIEAGMLAEIKGALGTEGEPPKKDEKPAAGGEAKPPAKEPAKPAGDVKAGETKDDKGGEKPKTHKDFAMSPEEERLLSEKSRQRFQGLITHAKTVEETNVRLQQQVEQVNAARGELLNLLEEHHMEPEELVDYLSLHKLIKTGSYKEALAEIDKVANTLRSHLGIKGEGFDPLKDHDDLRKQVDDGEITEERALELLRLRNAENSRRALEQTATERAQQQEQVRRVQQEALASIDAWDRQMAETDVDYKQKAAKIADKIGKVLQTYPPNLWLETIRLAYENIEVTPGGNGQTRQQGGGSKEKTPLRATGGVSGARAEPGDMVAALKQGLGYN